MTSVRWTTTVLACDDPAPVAAFWAALLDGELVRITDNFLAVRHGTAWLAAQRSAHASPATWPTGARPVQIHLDLAVSDLRQAVEHAVELGAEEEPDQPYPDSWRVMRAPGGHLFCLSPHIQNYLPVDFDQ
jgi:hypothetical protein